MNPIPIWERPFAPLEDSKPNPPKTMAEMAANLTDLLARSQALALQITERLSNDSKQGEGRG